MDASTPLVPQPKTWLRATILALLVVFALIGGSGPIATIVFCLVMAGLFGTFPRCRISSEQFEREWFVFFVPVRVERTCLADVTQIETDVEQKMGIQGGCLLSLFVGVQNVLMVWLLDWLIPWAGGDYKIWLRLLSRRRVLTYIRLERCSGGGWDGFTTRPSSTNCGGEACKRSHCSPLRGRRPAGVTACIQGTPPQN
jgi:hypothetical protein